MTKTFVAVIASIAFISFPASTYAITLNMVDMFTANTQNWFAGGLGNGQVPPIPPQQISTGGPAGTGDGFLEITASTLDDAGSRVVAINGAQWAGNYLTAGVNAIDMDLRNLGNTDLTVRLLLENPMMGPPADTGVTTSGAFLPAGGDWMHFVFPVSAGALTPLEAGDNMTTLLSNVTLLRIINSTAPDEADQALGQLGVDNIRATAVPEPRLYF